MAIFNSYVSLPEGKIVKDCQESSGLNHAVLASLWWIGMVMLQRCGNAKSYLVLPLITALSPWALSHITGRLKAAFVRKVKREDESTSEVVQSLNLATLVLVRSKDGVQSSICWFFSMFLYVSTSKRRFLKPCRSPKPWVSMPNWSKEGRYGLVDKTHSSCVRPGFNTRMQH